MAKYKTTKQSSEANPKVVSGKRKIDGADSTRSKAIARAKANAKAKLNGGDRGTTLPAARPTRLIAMLISLVTLVLAIQSVIHNDNWFYRIATQASLGVLMLVNAMEAILITKKSRLGLVLLGVSAVILISMIFTFYQGKLTHAF